jgi:tRNA dimethylallyltransferase
MTIGTGKDLSDYEIPGFGRVPCHLTDIADAGYHYNVFEYQRDFLRAFEEVRSGEGPGIVRWVRNVYRGGALGIPADSGAPRPGVAGADGTMTDEALTGLLCSLKPLHKPLGHREPQAADAGGGDCPVPAGPSFRGCGRSPVAAPDHRDASRPGTRRARITARLRQRLGEGLIEEVQELLRGGLTASDLEYYGLEYKFVTRFLTGGLSREQMETQLNTAIHQFAKRQMTWFRKMERDGFRIHWMDGSMTLPDMLLAIDALYYR